MMFSFELEAKVTVGFVSSRRSLTSRAMWMVADCVACSSATKSRDTARHMQVAAFFARQPFAPRQVAEKLICHAGAHQDKACPAENGIGLTIRSTIRSNHPELDHGSNRHGRTSNSTVLAED